MDEALRCHPRRGRTRPRAAAGDCRHRRNATAEAIRLTRCAERAGADACLLVTPTVLQQAHPGRPVPPFQAIAEAVPIPQIPIMCPDAPPATCCPRPSSGWRRFQTSSASKGSHRQSGPDARDSAALRRRLDLYSGDDAQRRSTACARRQGRYLGDRQRGAAPRCTRCGRWRAPAQTSKARAINDRLMGCPGMRCSSNPIRFR